MVTGGIGMTALLTMNSNEVKMGLFGNKGWLEGLELVPEYAVDW